MADDKMNPENERNLGGKMDDRTHEGQRSPGRNPNDDRSAGQHGERDAERKGQGDFDREGGRGGSHGGDDR